MSYKDLNQWVVCSKGKGYLYEKGKAETRVTHFPINSVGIVQQEDKGQLLVWLIGQDEEWLIPKEDTASINVFETGDDYKLKICNICHCLKPVGEFARNQNNVRGVVRRPTCISCRSDIEKRPPKTKQARDAEKRRPAKGTPFRCPICRKRSIVGITAKIVADHNHHTGDIRDFICDSCNTGLGRFKNGENYLMNAVNYLKDRD